MPTDIEIARSVTPLPITEVAKNAGVDVKHLIPYGFDKAKVDYSLLNEPTDHVVAASRVPWPCANLRSAPSLA